MPLQSTFSDNQLWADVREALNTNFIEAEQRLTALEEDTIEVSEVTGLQTALDARANKTANTGTGTSIVFTEKERIYVSTGNITLDTTGAILGAVVHVVHNAATASATPAGATDYGGDSYRANMDNVYTFKVLKTSPLLISMTLTAPV